MLKNNRGFTLIELVMVIVLLGILAAIAVPRFVDLQGEARLAVLDASVGAVRSSAVIQFARTRSTNTFASIRGATDVDTNVLFTTPQCTNGLLTYSGSSDTRSFSISTSFCSG